MSVRVLRDRHAETQRTVDRNNNVDPHGSGGILVQTTTFKTYPTVAQSYFAVVAVLVNGVEVEGGAVTFVPASPSTVAAFYALNLGSTIPPVGTKVIATGVGGRLTFRYDG